MSGSDTCSDVPAGGVRCAATPEVPSSDSVMTSPDVVTLFLIIRSHAVGGDGDVGQAASRHCGDVAVPMPSNARVALPHVGTQRCCEQTAKAKGERTRSGRRCRAGTKERKRGQKKRDWLSGSGAATREVPPRTTEAQHRMSGRVFVWRTQLGAWCRYRSYSSLGPVVRPQTRNRGPWRRSRRAPRPSCLHRSRIQPTRRRPARGRGPTQLVALCAVSAVSWTLSL